MATKEKESKEDEKKDGGRSVSSSSSNGDNDNSTAAGTGAANNFSLMVHQNPFHTTSLILELKQLVLDFSIFPYIFHIPNKMYCFLQKAFQHTTKI